MPLRLPFLPVTLQPLLLATKVLVSTIQFYVLVSSL